jgi:hypothetical protein
MFQYVIDDSDLERFDVINDLGVPVDSRMTFVGRIESIVSKSARMLGFIKRISKEFNNPYTYKTLYVAFSDQVWSMHRACGRLIKRFIRRELNAFNATL